MLDLDAIFTGTFEGWYMSNDTISRFAVYLHVLQDSRKRLWGKVESSDVGSLEMIIFIICHHFKVYQGLYILKMRLLGDGVLTGFLRLISIELSQKPHKDTSFVRSIRNSRKRHGGKMESWEGSWCFIMMKLTSYTILEPSTQRRDMEQRWRLHSHRLIFCQILVEKIFFWQNIHSSFRRIIHKDTVHKIL